MRQVDIPAALLRAAAGSDSGDIPPARDLDDEARSADVLVRIGAPLAAAMARGAVADEHTALAKRAAFRAPGGRL